MVHVLWLSVLVASVASFQEINFKNCKPTSGTNTCKVKSVEISGCLSPSSWVDQNGNIIEYPEEDMKNPCRIDRSSALNFSIVFEPGFSVSSIRSQFTLPNMTDCWSRPNELPSSQVTCPLADTPRQGCLHTKCPLEAGRQQRFDTTLQISTDVASRPVNLRQIYQMRWKLWNNKNKKHNCCFNFPIQY